MKGAGRDGGRWGLLIVWAATLAILTSLVVIEGTWVVQAIVEWPRPARAAQRRTIPLIVRHQATSPVAPTSQPAPRPFSTPRKAGASSSTLLYEIKYGMAVDAANLCGVEPGMVIGVAMRESAMRWPEPRHEALGYMQIKPASAALVSRSLNVRTAWGNFLAGACYYRQMLDRFDGDQHRALVAYHNGPNGGRSPKGIKYANDIMEMAQ